MEIKRDTSGKLQEKFDARSAGQHVLFGGLPLNHDWARCNDSLTGSIQSPSITVQIHFPYTELLNIFQIKQFRSADVKVQQRWHRQKSQNGDRAKKKVN